MDIQRWLDATVLPEQPPSPPEQQPGFPPILQSTETGQTHRERRTRRRSTSDSSLLDTRPRRKQISAIEKEDDVENSACSNALHSAGHFSGSSTSSQPYARRPRRKTRPERYDPTAKDVNERGMHTRQRRKGESKKTKRKSKPSRAEKPGTGIVQSFQAKNVPRDRLTLKPREKLGIFNQGRASSPVKGRGLPDLVFSEMKFLQRHKDQPEDVPKTGLPKKRHKKDPAHAREDEISAYFTTVRPALAEKDVNTQAKEGSKKKSITQDLDQERDRVAGIDNAIPTVELPDKASYLGFGSRGPRHESGSSISWSESIMAPSVTPIHPRTGSTIDVGQLDRIHCGRDGEDTNGGDVSHSRAAPPPVTRHTGSDGRFDVSSLAPENHRVSRSHSLPQHTSSPRHVDLVNRAVKSRRLETATSPSSMPPYIPHGAELVKQRHRHTNLEDAVESNGILESSDNPNPIRPQRGVVCTKSGHNVEDDVDPQKSSSLVRILQKCNSTFNERHRAAASYESNGFSMGLPARPSNEKESINMGSYGAAHKITTVRFPGGVETFWPIVPNFAPSIYEEQERRQQYMQQPHAENHGYMQEPYFGGVECLEGGDEMECGVPEWEALPEEILSHELGLGTLGEDCAGTYEMEHREQRLEQSEDVVARGFWRPHKLY